MNIRFFVTILAFVAAVNVEIFGQRAILLGVRDNEYARIGFLDKRNWYLMAEHSVFVTKLKNQIINGYVGYKGNWHKLKYDGCVYGGVHYGGMFKMAGVMANVNYPVKAWCNIFGGVRPHYDTSYGYDTAFRAGLSFAVHKDISLRGEFTSYPEYRLCEKRIKAGIDFNVLGLRVSPELSVPLEGSLENIRLIIGFMYKWTL